MRTVFGKIKDSSLENMNTTQFDIKNEGDLPSVTPNESFDTILKDSNEGIMTQ